VYRIELLVVLRSINSIIMPTAQDDEEKLALAEFAYSLGSTNSIAEAGTDQGDTRQEAELLMSLLFSPAPEENLEAVSSSESEPSGSEHGSDSSYYVYRKSPSSFRFVCPSLSLESAERSWRRAAVQKIHRDSPASLMGRTLQVDDRDALRLSADAMARNARQSLETAIEWRIQAWIQVLSKTLVNMEQEIRLKGASNDEINALRETKEASLILQLEQVQKNIQVMAASTSFQVMGHCSHADKDDEEPANKKLRTEVSSEFKESDYPFKVSYVLMMECVASLQTPAGFGEIALQVPGTIEGTFLSHETGVEELRSVTIHVDTEILAAMAEKCGRTVVRASVEANAAVVKEASLNDTAHVAAATTSIPLAIAMTSTAVTPGDYGCNKRKNVAMETFDDVNSDELAIITPRALFSGTTHGFGTPQSIPDNLDDSPRRISPTQAPSPEFSERKAILSPLTPVGTITHDLDNSPSMVTPPFSQESVYDIADECGPSLPLLVAVACRVMQSN
jgi:hypothetical protein